LVRRVAGLMAFPFSWSQPVLNSPDQLVFCHVE